MNLNRIYFDQQTGTSLNYFFNKKTSNRKRELPLKHEIKLNWETRTFKKVFQTLQRTSQFFYFNILCYQESNKNRKNEFGLVFTNEI
jgi:hypothetical protein